MCALSIHVLFVIGRLTGHKASSHMHARILKRIFLKLILSFYTCAICSSGQQLSADGRKWQATADIWSELPWRRSVNVSKRKLFYFNVHVGKWRIYCILGIHQTLCLLIISCQSCFSQCSTALYWKLLSFKSVACETQSSLHICVVPFLSHVPDYWNLMSFSTTGDCRSHVSHKESFVV